MILKPNEIECSKTFQVPTDIVSSGNPSEQICFSGPQRKESDFDAGAKVPHPGNGVTDGAVLANFLHQENVQHPVAYILHSTQTKKRWLPIFFYVRQMDQPIEKIVALVGREDATRAVTRGTLLRLAGRRSAHKKPSCTSAGIIQQIMDGTLPSARKGDDIRKQAVAIQGWTDRSFELTMLLEVLSKLRANGDESPDAKGSSEIRKAAAWIDELYFGPVQSTESRAEDLSWKS